MLVALVSLDQVWENKNANQMKCEFYIEKASKCNCELIIFPEMTLTGFSMNTELISEKVDDSPTIKFFCQMANKYKLSIGFGVVFKKKIKATNNFIIVDSSGKILSNYTKIHPFSFSGENKYYSGGEELVTCNVAKATIGLTICYDLRFPEIFQALSKSCNLILTIANWPERRVKHWNVLLQARAIENQSFTIGVNRTGIDGNNHSYIRSSVVFDPDGEKLQPKHTFLEMDIYNINLCDVITARSSFPMKQDRKTEFYRSILNTNSNA